MVSFQIFGPCITAYLFSNCCLRCSNSCGHIATKWQSNPLFQSYLSYQTTAQWYSYQYDQQETRICVALRKTDFSIGLSLKFKGQNPYMNFINHPRLNKKQRKLQILTYCLDSIFNTHVQERRGVVHALYVPLRVQDLQPGILSTFRN